MVSYEKVKITKVNAIFLFLCELFSNLVQVTIAILGIKHLLNLKTNLIVK